MKFTRDQYIELMTFGNSARPMFSELMGLLVGLEDEWRAQGATEDEINLTSFDWDYVPSVLCGADTVRIGVCALQEPEIIEETDKYIIQRDFLGRTLKMCKGMSTVPLPLDFPVKKLDDWLRIKKHFEFTEESIDWNAVEKAKHLQSQGVLVVARMPGGWNLPAELMGVEMACMAYYAEPELMQDIIKTVTIATFKILERVTDKLQIDLLSVHEDLAGTGGPIIGPNQIEEFIKPYYTTIWDLVSGRGTKLFDMDSDGNITAVIDVFLESGVNIIHPFEPNAGMDIMEVRKKYGKKLAIIGGIDKFVLQKSREDIRRELEYKMQPMMRDGGIVFGLDHRIPNGTSLENYRYYVNLGREILGIPPIDSNKKGGWVYMPA